MLSVGSVLFLFLVFFGGGGFGPPHLALNPPYLLSGVLVCSVSFCLFFCCFVFDVSFRV